MTELSFLDFLAPSAEALTGSSATALEVSPWP